MKVLCIGDPHFRHQLPYSTALLDGRRSEWRGVLDKLVELSQDCEEIILMGDNLNSKHNHSSVNREFIEFLTEFGDKPIHMLVGNHERYGHETALDFIKEINHPTWNVYSDITEIMIGDKKAVMLPFMTPGTLDSANLEEAQAKLAGLLPKADYLIHHHIAEGTLWSQTAETTDLNEVYVPKDSLDNYDLVIGGHIHKRQWVTPKVLVTGNLFTNEVGEHDKAVFTLDTDTNKVEEHLVPVRGIYKIEMRKEESLPKEIPDNSIVKIVCVDPAFGRQAREAMIAIGADKYDDYVIVEQYPRKRRKVKISETGALDFSLDNLTKVYSKARKVPHAELLAGLELLET